ncbi:Alpha/Beta hydrolase protein [Butyriboletus roseoflavus]|nr:Alpha/Beta hydrolase protein [Butyriboletus roseoflavus]
MSSGLYKASLGESPVYHHRHSSDVDGVLVSLQQCPGGLHAPLYLVHDESGLVNHYERLLPLHRDVWGLSNPRFFHGEPWETVEEMARAYALAIEQHANDAPLMLGGRSSAGWSFGGVVAFETARILTCRGVKIKNVPSTPLVTRQFKQSTALLDKYVPGIRDAAEVPLAFLRCTAGFCPDGMEGVAAWFGERDDVGSVVGPWEALAGRAVPVWDVPGHHFEPFSHVHVSRSTMLWMRMRGLVLMLNA